MKFIERLRKLKNSVQKNWAMICWVLVFSTFKQIISKDMCINCTVFFFAWIWIEVQWLGIDTNKYSDFGPEVRRQSLFLLMKGWLLNALITRKGAGHILFFFYFRSFFARIFIRPSIKYPAHFQFSSFSTVFHIGCPKVFSLSLSLFLRSPTSFNRSLAPYDISHKPLRRCVLI